MVKRWLLLIFALCQIGCQTVPPPPKPTETLTAPKQAGYRQLLVYRLQLADQYGQSGFCTATDTNMLSCQRDLVSTCQGLDSFANKVKLGPYHFLVTMNAFRFHRAPSGVMFFRRDYQQLLTVLLRKTDRFIIDYVTDVRPLGPLVRDAIHPQGVRAGLRPVR